MIPCPSTTRYVLLRFLHEKSNVEQSNELNSSVAHGWVRRNGNDEGRGRGKDEPPAKSRDGTMIAVKLLHKPTSRYRIVVSPE